MKPTPQEEFMPYNKNPAQPPQSMSQQIIGPVDSLYYCVMLLHTYLFLLCCHPVLYMDTQLASLNIMLWKNLRTRERNALSHVVKDLNCQNSIFTVACTKNPPKQGVIEVCQVVFFCCGRICKKVNNFGEKEFILAFSSRGDVVHHG